jgi:hypothetical protein
MRANECACVMESMVRHIANVVAYPEIANSRISAAKKYLHRCDDPLNPHDCRPGSSQQRGTSADGNPFSPLVIAHDRRKSRKAHFAASSGEKRKIMSSPLNKELRAKHNVSGDGGRYAEWTEVLKFCSWV